MSIRCMPLPEHRGGQGKVATQRSRLQRMNCYQCDEEGQERAAVGVCQQCGRAVCRRHSILQHLPVHRKVAAGMGFRVEVLPAKQARIVCQECGEAEDIANQDAADNT